MGSSYLPSEIVAAFLWAQIGRGVDITRRRLAIWDTYHELLAACARTGAIRLPVVPPECGHNAHMYYVLLPTLATRTAFIDRLKARGVYEVFHYVPLHSSPFGRSAVSAGSDLPVTDDIPDRLV